MAHAGPCPEPLAQDARRGRRSRHVIRSGYRWATDSIGAIGSASAHFRSPKGAESLHTETWSMKMKKLSKALTSVGLASIATLSLTASALAQMDNGPPTEKQYGVGLPRDHA